MHKELKVDFPVYALFTKADLIAGFAEYFGNFTESRRRKVWGATFQTTDRKKNMVGEVPAEFDALVKRLTEELTDRLHEEPDGISRIAIFGFPAQFASLKDRVADFLNKIFEPTRYQANANLRGFYFSSGTQEGTPIDQVLGAMDRSFGTGSGLRYMSGGGRSFFLNELLTKVIFAESGWVSFDRSAVRRASILRYGSMAAIGIVSALVLRRLGLELCHQQGADHRHRQCDERVPRQRRRAAQGFDRVGHRPRERRRHPAPDCATCRSATIRATSRRRCARPSGSASAPASSRPRRPATGRRWKGCSARASSCGWSGRSKPR